ncbi:hypothetical protein ACLH0K_01735 [Arthrobacter sp. MPF02]|uniref:hypothetical protein n=1 Tax=Arthrobacter sp. MPF02 TaxID=3388492 RepID=UPI0039852A50
MNAEYPTAASGEALIDGGGSRPDVSNPNVREDVAQAGRCALVHLPTGRTCLLPLRHQGPCDFHGPQEAESVAGSR